SPGFKSDSHRVDAFKIRGSRDLLEYISRGGQQSQLGLGFGGILKLVNVVRDCAHGRDDAFEYRISGFGRCSFRFHRTPPFASSGSMLRNDQSATSQLSVNRRPISATRSAAASA